MRILRLVPLVALALCCATAGLAGDDKAAPAAPQPTAEHKVLSQWTGHWSGEGDMKPGPMGPGGRMTWTEDCDWFGGTEFAVVCKSKGDSPMGPAKGLGIITYNAGKGVYTHYGVDSNGWAGYSEGTREGNTWTFTSEEVMGDKSFHSRFSMEMVSPTEMSFAWQVSEDGKTWTTMMDGTSKKK